MRFSPLLALTLLLTACHKPDPGPLPSADPASWLNGAPLDPASAHGAVVLIEAWGPT